jgi:hypothetical protein
MVHWSDWNATYTIDISHNVFNSNGGSKSNFSFLLVVLWVFPYPKDPTMKPIIQLVQLSYEVKHLRTTYWATTPAQAQNASFGCTVETLGKYYQFIFAAMHCIDLITQRLFIVFAMAAESIRLLRLFSVKHVHTSRCTWWPTVKNIRYRYLQGDPGLEGDLGEPGQQGAKVINMDLYYAYFGVNY